MWFQRLVEIDNESDPEPIPERAKRPVAVRNSVTKNTEVVVPTPADFQRVRLMSILRLKEQKAKEGSQQRTLHYLTNDESPSPSDSESPAQQTSNATVAPLDIISRKPVPGVSIATSSHLEQPNSHMERTSTRTPSPNGLSSLVGDALAGVEGPMTPRNDAGPFIFDGSAGRGADVQLAALATMNLTAAAVTPLPETPQSAA